MDTRQELVQSYSPRPASWWALERPPPEEPEEALVIPQPPTSDQGQAALQIAACSVVPPEPSKLRAVPTPKGDGMCAGRHSWAMVELTIVRCIGLEVADHQHHTSNPFCCVYQRGPAADKTNGEGMPVLASTGNDYKTAVKAHTLNPEWGAKGDDNVFRVRCPTDPPGGARGVAAQSAAVTIQCWHQDASHGAGFVTKEGLGSATIPWSQLLTPTARDLTLRLVDIGTTVRGHAEGSIVVRVETHALVDIRLLTGFGVSGDSAAAGAVPSQTCALVTHNGEVLRAVSGPGVLPRRTKSRKEAPEGKDPSHKSEADREFRHLDKQKLMGLFPPDTSFSQANPFDWDEDHEQHASYICHTGRPQFNTRFELALPFAQMGNGASHPTCLHLVDAQIARSRTQTRGKNSTAEPPPIPPRRWSATIAHSRAELAQSLSQRGVLNKPLFPVDGAHERSKASESGAPRIEFHISVTDFFALSNFGDPAESCAYEAEEKTESLQMLLGLVALANSFEILGHRLFEAHQQTHRAARKSVTLLAAVGHADSIAQKIAQNARRLARIKRRGADLDSRVTQTRALRTEQAGKRSTLRPHGALVMTAKEREAFTNGAQICALSEQFELKLSASKPPRPYRHRPTEIEMAVSGPSEHTT